MNYLLLFQIYSLESSKLIQSYLSDQIGRVEINSYFNDYGHVKYGKGQYLDFFF